MSFKDYLPSKNFQKKVFYIFLVIVSIVVFILLIKLIGLGIKKLKERHLIKQLPVELQAEAKTMTIGELQKKDTNKNGIPDWEERLFGLDPTADGNLNKKLVEEKRAILKAENADNSNIGVEDNTETAKFAQEYLNLVMSLEGSGVLSEDALSNISDSVGSSITNYDLPDVFSSWDIKTVDNSNISKDIYLNKLLAELTTITKTNGTDELSIIANGLKSDEDASKIVLTFAKTYKNSAINMKNYYTPKGVMSQHLTIVNSLDHIGTALENMQKPISDPARAAKGMIQYQVYSETLNNAIQEIHDLY